MAVQEWTIIKLVGPAAGDASTRVERWWRARRCGDLSLVSATDWPPSVRRSAASYLARLVDHRLQMPVAYFSQHADLWLTGFQVLSHLGGATTHVYHDTGELWCYRLPDGGKLIRRNRERAKSSQFSESEWLAKRLIEAARAYDELWPEAVLLINRRAIKPSSTDKELKLIEAKLPKWVGRQPRNRRIDGYTPRAL